MFGALVESDDIEDALLVDTQQARRSAPHTSHPLPTQQPQIVAEHRRRVAAGAHTILSRAPVPAPCAAACCM